MPECGAPTAKLCKPCGEATWNEKESDNFVVSCVQYPPEKCWAGLGTIPGFLAEACKDLIEEGTGLYLGVALKDEPVEEGNIHQTTVGHECGWNKELGQESYHDDEEMFAKREPYFCALRPICRDDRCPAGTFLARKCIMNVQRTVCMKCSQGLLDFNQDYLTGDRLEEFKRSCVPTTNNPPRPHYRQNFL